VKSRNALTASDMAIQKLSATEEREAGDHLTSNCPRKVKSKNIKCVLCKGNHPANYKGFCSVGIMIVIMRRKIISIYNYIYII